VEFLDFVNLLNCGLERMEGIIRLGGNFWEIIFNYFKDYFAALLFILYYVVVVKILFISCFADHSRTDEINVI